MFSPVIKLASSESKNIHNLAVSSGVANLPNGVSFNFWSISSCFHPFNDKGVGVNAGQILFALIYLSANSKAVDLVKLIIPAAAAQ